MFGLAVTGGRGRSLMMRLLVLIILKYSHFVPKFAKKKLHGNMVTEITLTPHKLES